MQRIWPGEFTSAEPAALGQQSASMKVFRQLAWWRTHLSAASHATLKGAATNARQRLGWAGFAMSNSLCTKNAASRQRVGCQQHLRVGALGSWNGYRRPPIPRPRAISLLAAAASVAGWAAARLC